MRSGWWLLLLLVASVACAAQTKYSEPYRPQYHFSPPQNFMNDANGMVYFRGEYHLFYQHNPQGNVWGHMSWGHAVSPDMVHWQNLPVAIPEAQEYMIFSGSAAVDWKNSSGLCDRDPCLVAIYTAHSEGWQRQNIAYSLDRGRAWKEYSGNPVIDLHKPDFRDPKVFWFEPQKKWVLVTVFADERQAVFFESKDLKSWKQMSTFGPGGTTQGQWECPDLMQLPIAGTRAKKWVLIISRNPGAPQGGTGVQYFVGNFDGTKFTSETSDSQKMWIDYGKDFYATQRFADLPASDKRIIWMGWVGDWLYANKEPTSPWRGVQSIPRELFLRKCQEGYCVDQRPIRELESLREKAIPLKFNGRQKELDIALPSASFELEAEIASARECQLFIHDSANHTIVVGFDPEKRQVYVDRTESAQANFSPDFPGRHAGAIASGNRVRLHIFVDQTTLELFANDGERVITDRVYLNGAARVGLQSASSDATATLTLWPMKSIWR